MREKNTKKPFRFQRKYTITKVLQTTTQSACSDLHPEADIKEYDKSLECELQNYWKAQNI